jgi:hypothetical protein
MNVREARAGKTGAWLALVCCLAGCNAAPDTQAQASVGPEVTAAVRALTDRSGAQSQVVTLPNGERLRRVSLPNGYNHVLLAKPGPDGKPDLSCVDSAPAPEASLKAGPQQGGAQ